MRNAVVIAGRLVGPRQVELDEPVSSLGAQVEVIIDSQSAAQAKNGSLAAFLDGLPPGSRSREDIDRQLASERVGWELECFGSDGTPDC